MTTPIPTPTPGRGGPAAPRRWTAAAPFVVMGGLALLAAGLVAAATAYAPSFHASWATAYLVLVVGVAQLGLGVGQATLTNRAIPARTLAFEFLAFNLGHAGVLAGAVSDRHGLTDVGGALLLPALAAMLWSVRGAGPRRGWPVRGYRAAVAILLVSIPIGLVLARFSPA